MPHFPGRRFSQSLPPAPPPSKAQNKYAQNIPSVRPRAPPPSLTPFVASHARALLLSLPASARERVVPPFPFHSRSILVGLLRPRSPLMSLDVPPAFVPPPATREPLLFRLMPRASPTDTHPPPACATHPLAHPSCLCRVGEGRFPSLDGAPRIVAPARARRRRLCRPRSGQTTPRPYFCPRRMHPEKEGGDARPRRARNERRLHYRSHAACPAPSPRTLRFSHVLEQRRAAAGSPSLRPPRNNRPKLRLTFPSLSFFCFPFIRQASFDSTGFKKPKCA